MKNFLLLLPLSAVVLLSGCSDNESAPVPTKTQLLTARSWKMTAYTVNPALPVNGATITDLYGENLLNCAKDDTLKFSAENSTATKGTYTIDEGPSKCNIGHPQVHTYNWIFNSDQTKMTVTSENLFLDVEIVELTAMALRRKYTHTYHNITYTFTETYTTY